MNIELILWIASGIIIWEIIYILFLKYAFKEDWVFAKLISFLFTASFMVIQLYIVGIIKGGIDGGVFVEIRNYINLLWEFLIVNGITLFFLLNKWIAKKIT